MQISPERAAEMQRATRRARAAIRPGDLILREACLGTMEPFYFCAWEGGWMCGNFSASPRRPRRGEGWGVCDCTALGVRAINGQPVDFSDAGNVPY